MAKTLTSILYFDGQSAKGEVAPNPLRHNLLIYNKGPVSLIVGFHFKQASSDFFSIMIGPDSWENMRDLVGEYTGRVTFAWDGGAPGTGKAYITESVYAE